jgi:type VI secretion system secreted protein VgrG
MHSLRWSSPAAMRRHFVGQPPDAAAALGDEAELAFDGLGRLDVRVVAFRAEEHANALYRFDAVARIGGAHEEALRSVCLGRGCHLRLQRPRGEPRAFHGIVAEADLQGYREGFGYYLITIVPKVWLATKTVDSRVFQDMTVQLIATEILREHGVPHAWSLARAYDKREYVLQYEESDWEFLCRILAEDGIFFTFEHPATIDRFRELFAMGLPSAVGGEIVSLAQGGFDGDALMGAGMRLAQGAAAMQVLEGQPFGEVMVLADTAASYPRIAEVPELVYRSELSGGALALAETHVQRFGVKSSVTPTRSTVRGFAPERAQVRPYGTVIGTVPPGYQGAFADAISAAVEAASDVTERPLGELQRGAGVVGPLAQATGFQVSDPAAELGRYNEHWSHGVVTATHGMLAPEVALARSAVAVAGELGDALLAQTPVAGMAGGIAGGVGGMLGGAEAGLEIYSHHDEYEKTEASFELARLRLEQLRAGHVVCTGFTHCRLLSPGFRFELADHDLSHLNRGYALVAVVHELYAGGGTTAIYHNELTCIPDDVPARPPPPRRRFHQAVETGMVVGPDSHEIFTEHLGRVKVQFHWDRRGKHDDRSSCWIRVMQPWAGAGFGFQFIPRIGMEVLVSFVGGDMNRPVVIGCMPSTANPVPHGLPQDATRSGIRTHSTPGASGHNELMFDDNAGHEAVYLRAQRNHTEQVGHDQLVAVRNDQRIAVEGSRIDSVTGDRAATVGGHATDRIQGDLHIQAGRHGHQQYGGDLALSVTGDAVEDVRGNHTHTVSGYHQLIVGGPDGGFGQVTVRGSYHIGAGNVAITARDRISLRVGDSQLVMTGAGIELGANSIRLQATKNVVADVGDTELRLDKNVAIVGEKVTQHSSGACVLLDGDARVNGGRVLLNCSGDGPERTSGEGGDEEGRARFTFDLPEGMTGPLTLVFASPTGEVIERQTDGGPVDLEGVAGDRFTLREVRAGDFVLAMTPPDEAGGEDA